MRTPRKLTLSEKDHATRNRWVKSRAVGDKQKLRAKMVLRPSEGCPTQEILQTLKVSAATLNLWRRRYLDCGSEGLKKGTTRPSRVPPLPVEKVQDVLTLA